MTNFFFLLIFINTPYSDFTSFRIEGTVKIISANMNPSVNRTYNYDLTIAHSETLRFVNKASSKWGWRYHLTYDGKTLDGFHPWHFSYLFPQWDFGKIFFTNCSIAALLFPSFWTTIQDTNQGVLPGPPNTLEKYSFVYGQKIYSSWEPEGQFPVRLSFKFIDYEHFIWTESYTLSEIKQFDSITYPSKFYFEDKFGSKLLISIEKIIPDPILESGIFSPSHTLQP